MTPPEETGDNGEQEHRPESEKLGSTRPDCQFGWVQNGKSLWAAGRSGGNVDIVAELTKMQERIVTNSWDAFQTHYENLCAAANPVVAKRIADKDLNYFNDRLYDAYCKALKKARSADALAIYFEYDIDNDWRSSFFVCKDYAAPQANDDDWACRWVGHLVQAALQAEGLNVEWDGTMRSRLFVKDFRWQRRGP